MTKLRAGNRAVATRSGRVRLRRKHRASVDQSHGGSGVVSVIRTGTTEVVGVANGPLDELAHKIRVCTQCPLCESRTIAVPGEGRPEAQVMIIGEGPGAKEDKTGRPFVGSAGKYLEHILKGTRFTREDFFITNTVKCRPPGNRTPRVGEVETCTSLYLFEQIRIINPRLIVLLGSAAVNRMVGLKSVEQARGKVIEKDGRKFLATYHPAVRFYREDLAQKIKEDFALLTEELKQLE